MSGIDLYRECLMWGVVMFGAFCSLLAFYKVMKIEDGQNKKH